jgi:hypothetical protein
VEHIVYLYFLQSYDKTNNKHEQLVLKFTDTQNSERISVEMFHVERLKYYLRIEAKNEFFLYF